LAITQYINYIGLKYNKTMNILLKNANLITMDESQPEVLNNYDLLIENGKIRKIEKNIKVTKGLKVINCSNKYITPGLINCHCHIAMSLFKEISDGHKLQQWLEEDIWPIENKMSKEDFYWFALNNCLESLYSGVTLLNDMYYNVDTYIPAIEKTGIDFVETITVTDVDGKEKGKNRIENFKKFCKKYPNIKKSASIHGFYVASTGYIKEFIKVAKEMKIDLFHVHWCENDEEVKTICKNHNVKDPSEVLLKVFDKTNVKLVLAHCVSMSNKNIEALKKLNASVATNPVSNMRLGCGFCDLTKMKKNKINIALGTDGDGSGSNGSILWNASTACLIQKGLYKDPTLFPSYEGLKMATINGAKALGLEKTKGSLEIGKDADLVIWNLNDSKTNPINDVVSDILYNGSETNVEYVFVKGKCVINKGKHFKFKQEDVNKKLEFLKSIIKHK